MDLENLEVVDLSENNMKHFPTILCSLSLLMDLKIGHNNITRLPVQLGRLSNLKKLGLESLQLVQPAAEIANLSAPGIVEYLRKFFRVDKGENVYPMIPAGAAHHEIILGPGQELDACKSEEGMVLV